jgi:alkylated DNA repair dioxygenase AlkB
MNGAIVPVCRRSGNRADCLAMLEPLALAGADLLYDPRWLPAGAADKLFAALNDPVQAGISWEVHRIRLFGREVDSPRLSRWIGDPGAAYRYSGVRFEPSSWPRALGVIRKAVSAAAGEQFNSVLANLYRDGNDSMGWHSDDEPELGAQPIIASLSLGATRKFVLKSRAPDGDKLELMLAHGSLLVMRGDTQKNFRHALPRTRRAIGPRLNLTFRRIYGQKGV